jgi:hypothetical protein
MDTVLVTVANYVRQIEDAHMGFTYITPLQSLGTKGEIEYEILKFWTY